MPACSKFDGLTDISIAGGRPRSSPPRLARSAAEELGAAVVDVLFGQAAIER
jgi:hypothetical protein